MRLRIRNRQAGGQVSYRITVAAGFVTMDADLVAVLFLPLYRYYYVHRALRDTKSFGA